jgi:hypothetical protein|tara:strand:+ start:363 stop:620 length:258 start_codon:yes stop_codon:yes gene_type:complete
MINKNEELKHSIILLEDATTALFKKMKYKKFKKRKLVQIESAFLDLIGVITKGIFKDYQEYRSYCEDVQKEIDEHMENMKKRFMA